MAELEHLAAIRTVDITTFGRKSGRPHRIEIWWFHVDGRFVITGTPGRRDWLANVLHDPRVIVHAGDDEIEALVEEIRDPVFRRRVFTHGDTGWYTTQSELDHLVAAAPMVEIHLPAHGSGRAPEPGPPIS